MLEINDRVRVKQAEFETEEKLIGKEGQDISNDSLEPGLFLVKFSNGEKYPFWDWQLTKLDTSDEAKAFHFDPKQIKVIRR